MLIRHGLPEVHAAAQAPPGAASTGTQSGYTSGAVTIDAMLKAVPGINDLADIKGEQISNVGSTSSPGPSSPHFHEPEPVASSISRSSRARGRTA